MSRPKVVQDEDVRFERRWHRFEQVCWTVLVLFLAVGASGLLGRGALSRRSVEFDGGGQLTYDRWLRARAPAELRLRLPANGGTVRVRIAGALATEARLREVTPAPAGTEPGEGSLVLRYETPVPATILMTQQADGLGARRSEIGLVGRQPAAIEQWVLP